MTERVQGKGGLQAGLGARVMGQHSLGDRLPPIGIKSSGLAPAGRPHRWPVSNGGQCDSRDKSN